ncbi:tyrosine-type recombinase/integrase [Mycoplasmatota bacterium]|nr:tyrosine-type recombinase/integrase [Mycoplasmatota bacterium]
MYFRRLDDKTIKVRPHQIRHTFATMLQGMNPKEIQQLLGHSDLETTLNIYTHFKPYQENTIENLEKEFKKYKM